jgi:hypothetical protein
VRAFSFNDVQQLTGLVESVNAGFALYNDHNPELERELLALLDRAVAVYRQRGRQDRESQLLSLKAEIVTARRAVHPLTLEKVTLRRHEMQNTIAFKALQAVELQLRADLQAATDTLQRAEDLLSQVLVAAMQKGLITDATIVAATTQAAIEALWTGIAVDPDIALARKRVLLMVSGFDVLLLLDGLLSRLR